MPVLCTKPAVAVSLVSPFERLVDSIIFITFKFYTVANWMFFAAAVSNKAVHCSFSSSDKSL